MPIGLMDCPTVIQSRRHAGKAWNTVKRTLNCGCGIAHFTATRYVHLLLTQSNGVFCINMTPDLANIGFWTWRRKNSGAPHPSCILSRRSCSVFRFLALLTSFWTSGSFLDLGARFAARFRPLRTVTSGLSSACSPLSVCPSSGILSSFPALRSSHVDARYRKTAKARGDPPNSTKTLAPSWNAT